jgi:hypothetical protein
MQPDNPQMSCCGDSDAYWCDVFGTEKEFDVQKNAYVTRNYCEITDDRDDFPLRRPHVPIGTRVYIPDEKMKWNPNDPQNADTAMERNPTSHAIVFLSRGYYVYCFVPGVLM